MSSRYNSTEYKTTTFGTPVYRSTIYPDIPFSDSDVYVMTESGDRLDILAYDYYQDSTLWWIIAAANNIHDAPIGLKPGLTLRIPTDQSYIQSLFDK